MKTYLAFDNNLYKIGRSNNPEKRVSELKTANPSIRLIFYGNGDKEKILHQMFENCRVAREWFDLTDAQVREAKSLIGEDLNRFTNLKKVVDFGKYRGLQVSELNKQSHIKYMQWFINNSDDKYGYWEKVFKFQLKRLKALSKNYKGKRYR